ncbi:hypothetical protein ACLOJK_026638 [Asimina triloba]
MFRIRIATNTSPELPYSEAKRKENSEKRRKEKWENQTSPNVYSSRRAPPAVKQQTLSRPPSSFCQLQLQVPISESEYRLWAFVLLLFSPRRVLAEISPRFPGKERTRSVRMFENFTASCEGKGDLSVTRVKKHTCEISMPVGMMQLAIAAPKVKMGVFDLIGRSLSSHACDGRVAGRVFSRCATDGCDCTRLCIRNVVGL